MSRPSVVATRPGLSLTPMLASADDGMQSRPVSPGSARSEVSWSQSRSQGHVRWREDPRLTIWRHRGRCRSLAQVNGSYRVVRRLVSAGAVAALWCCRRLRCVRTRDSLPVRYDRPVRLSVTSRSADSRVAINSLRSYVVVIRHGGQIRQGMLGATRLTAVIAGAGRGPWDAHLAAVDDASICSIVTLDVGIRWQHAGRTR